MSPSQMMTMWWCVTQQPRKCLCFHLKEGCSCSLLLVYRTKPLLEDHYAIFHGGKYFVSAVKQMVRVFDSLGAHLYDIGTGQLDTPAGLAVDANDLLLVCDQVSTV